MKKYLLLTLIAIYIGIIIPCKAYSVDISVGTTIWALWMERKYESGSGGPTMTQRDRHDQTFLYGPAMSAQFNDNFNLTFIYLYGQFDGTASFNGKVKRTDSDLALNYRLNDYFKAFGGLKYMAFSESALDSSGINDRYNAKHKGYGPGLGLSATLPVTENVYILTTLSGFYLWGKESGNASPSTPPPTIPFKQNYNEYGINTTISIAYYITPASTTISLGKRFQYFRTKYDGDVPRGGFNGDLNSMKNKFYGTTLTATYSFSI